MEYLNESYGGSLMNKLENDCFFCYTIKDLSIGKYYSGSRGVRGSNEHDLMKKYFTSSSVIDFKERLKNFPDKFKIRVEYFSTRAEAFLAETEFHKKHIVGKNEMFINSANAGGSNCGAGSVLCRDESGRLYRVSVEEYSSGRHKHMTAGTVTIRTDDGLKKIKLEEYDPEKHISQFKNHVVAINTETGKRCRIPKEQFISDKKYVGLTKGIACMFDTLHKKYVRLTSDELANAEPGRYVGNTTGKVVAIEKDTGNHVLIDKTAYNREKYSHPNGDKVVVYSILERKTIRVSKQEYHDNQEKYANLTSKFFYEIDGIFFKSKKQAASYYRETRHKNILGTQQEHFFKKFTDIKVITKEEHQNEKH